MSDKVILLAADENYLSHAKHLMVNCLREGCWDGDFAVIVPEATDTQQIDGRGITVVRVPATGFLIKFFVFSDCFQRWSVALYLDCDCIVQGKLECLVQQLAEYETLSDGSKPIIADLQDDPAWMVFERAAHGTKERDALFMQLVEEHPCVLRKFWNSSVLLFEPATIPSDTVQRLVGLQEKYRLINNQTEEGTDQQIIHIGLYDRIRRVKEKLFCFWGLDEPNAQVQSETRGWRGDEIPVILHYCRWHAPWIVKTSDMDAYYNRRLDRVCHEFYAKNLSDFEKGFAQL